MIESYRRIGDFISVIDNRNIHGDISKLIGISIDKCYIPSVANVIGTDLRNYKVIKKGQFACSLMQVSRDQRIPLAMYPYDEPAIMSPAYVMFEVNDPNTILPEYMELWFMRAEFDREASFYAVGGVRGSLDWEDFCNMKLPVPPISEQRKIVRDYQIVVDRIRLLQNLDSVYFEMISTIFNTWIVDHLFADKTKGMLSTPYGEIPWEWKYIKLGDLCDVVTKGTTPTTFDMDYTDEGVNFIKGESINNDHSFNESLFAHIDSDTDEFLKRSRIQDGDILFTIAGTLGKFAMAEKTMLPANTNQAVAIIRINPKKFAPGLLYSYFVGGWQTEFYKRNTQQAVQANLSLETIKELPLPIPDSDYLEKYKGVIQPLLATVWKNHREIQLLETLSKSIVAHNVMGG